MVEMLIKRTAANSLLVPSTHTHESPQDITGLFGLEFTGNNCATPK